MTKYSENEQSVEQLLKLSGPRPMPPESAYEDVRSNVREAWQRRVRCRRKNTLLGALAATVAIAALGIAWLPMQQSTVVDTRYGTVARVNGTLTQLGDEPLALKLNDSVYGGKLYTTSDDGGASLTLSGGASLRVSAATTLQVVNARQLQLLEGRIYLDTIDSRANTRFEITTPLGTVRNMGTQFEVTAAENSVRVRVRGGAVLFNTSSGEFSAQRGEALELDSRGQVSKGSFSPTDEAWGWVSELRPDFETDNIFVAEMVEWASRESGLSIRYDDALTRNRLRITRIYGSLPTDSPIESLQTALAATHFSAEITAESIVVSRATD